MPNTFQRSAYLISGMKMAENWDIIEIRLYASQNNYVENKGGCYE